jgi:ribosomal protein L7/L12
LADSLQEEVRVIEERLALIEVRLEQLFEHLDIAPRASADEPTQEALENDPASDPEIQDLLAKGNAAQATKRYKELTGVSLDEAKRAIDEAQAGG